MNTMRWGWLAVCVVAVVTAAPVSAGEAKAGDEVRAGTAADYFRLAAEHKARKEWGEAKDKLVRGLLIEPNNQEGLADLAWVCNERREHDDALKVCRFLLQTNNRNAPGWRELGYALLMKGEHELAAKSLALAITLNRQDRSTRTYFTRALAGLERQGKDELADQLRAAVRELDESALEV